MCEPDKFSCEVSFLFGSLRRWIYTFFHIYFYGFNSFSKEIMMVECLLKSCALLYEF